VLKKAEKMTAGNKISTLLLLMGLLANPTKEANAESLLALNLFPKEPLYRTSMADPDLFHSEIKFPAKSIALEKVLETPISELLEYSSLAKTLPVVSGDFFPNSGRFSDKVLLNANLVASGLIKLPARDTDADISYKTKLELFMRSPMVDDNFSEGNRFYLTSGWVGEGASKLEKNFLDKDIPSIIKSAKSGIEKHGFFADAYIVGKSPYSDQYLIFRIGVDNLLGSTPEKPNVYFSTTWEFPSICKNLKVSPYFSSHVKIPTDDSGTEFRGQLGLKLWGESNREIDLYGEVNYAQETDEPWKFFYGTKFSL